MLALPEKIRVLRESISELPNHAHTFARVVRQSGLLFEFNLSGIRAVAGENPLDPTTIYAVGLALAHTLRRQTADPAVILGRDTRESSPWIAATLAAGLRTAGARVVSAGVAPTPAVAFGGRRIAWVIGEDRLPVELVEGIGDNPPDIVAL